MYDILDEDRGREWLRPPLGCGIVLSKHRQAACARRVQVGTEEHAHVEGRTFNNGRSRGGSRCGPALASP